jgi:uncharacterized repeat protein (TIGR01451 family)
MNTPRIYKQQKPRAQAMVEFALALPLLLLLLYGTLETGRLIFIYSSTVTAARQAVRYGSATGDSPNGVPYYRDCVGITAAADAVGFINDFQNVTIQYDSGPGTTTKGTCPSYTAAQNGDRITVAVEAEWLPIVDLVPLEPFTIRSESARTILASVAIQVTAPAIYLPGADIGILNISVSPSSATYSAAGEVITYTYTLTNTGSADLTTPHVINDSLGVSNLSCPNSSIPPTQSITCTSTYTITQADMNNGSVASTVNGSSGGLASVNTATTLITAIQNPSLSLSISPDPQATSVAGATVTYTYTLTNNGNVTISSPYNISDNKISGVTCPGTPVQLDPGQSVICAKAYQITAGDVSAGEVVNQATGSGTFNAATVTSNLATATVYTTRLYVTTLPSATTATAAGQIITYTYRIRNNSNVPYSGLVVTSSRTPTVNCPSTSIAPGNSVECTGTYTVTQPNMNAGGLLVNVTSATAEGGTITSNVSTNNVAIQQNTSLAAVITATPSAPTPPALSMPVGTVITYTYTLTNNGNVTLTTPFSVTDNKTTITCANQTELIPGGTRTCTGTYAITQADIDGGTVVNTGKGFARFGAQTVESPAATFTVVAFSGARFTVGLAANPTTLTQSGTSVQFTYTITNTGNVPLSSPYAISHTVTIAGQSPQNLSFNCNGVSPLAPGASTSCTNSFTTSNTITNTVTSATARNGALTVNATAPLPSVTVNSTICTTGTLTISNFSRSGSSVLWTISNNIGTPITIDTISVTWSTSGQRYLGEVILGGTSIWVGSDKDGFALFDGDWVIPIGNTTLTMVFTKTNTSVSDMNLTFVEIGCGPLNNP